MRRYDLPPLDLLETFEAAARHLSFTRAADELALTQSAVSRQIQALEERLGVALFARLHRALRLTEAGERLHAATGEVLKQLHGVVGELRPGARKRRVVVTTTAGFAGLWLIPRLAAFTAERPDVDVRISANNVLLDLEREGIDIAVRYCSPRRAGAAAPRLFGESITPVCSPALARRKSQPLRRPADLRHHLLLHLETPMPGGHPLEWPMWLRAMGCDGLQAAGELHFSQYDQMVQAAVQGQGVALGRLPLVAAQLARGDLVAPFPAALESPMAYHLLRSSASAGRPEVDAFAAWLLAKAAAVEERPWSARASGQGSSGRRGRAPA